MEGHGIGTYDCQRNSYANSKLVSKNPNGVRIDHILYRPGLGAKVGEPIKTLLKQKE